MNKWVLIGIIIACNACADLLDTAGMRRNGEVTDFGPKGVLHLFHSLIRNRFLLGGCIAMALSFAALLSVLSIAEVSFVVPATAASFLVETILARLILKESVHWQRWLGAAMVGCGVALLAFP